MLYQLSYAPVRRCLGPCQRTLRLVAAAKTMLRQVNGFSCTLFSENLVSGNPQVSLRLYRAQSGSRIGSHLITFVTTPEPTVRPPSRIAKRTLTSIAMGEINSTDNLTLSPGMHISASPNRFAEPVTSVVRK